MDEPLVGEVVGQRGPTLVSELAQPYARRRRMAQLLVAVNVGVYLLMVLRGVSPLNPSLDALHQWGALDPVSFFAGQHWRILTSQFVHIGILHLALNMWCLWSLAELAESLFGGWTTVAVYLLSGATGGLLSIVWTLVRYGHGPWPISAGASGAIFGIAGAIVTSLRLGRHRLHPEVRRSISNSALRFALLNLVFGMLPGVDNAAHLGGMVGGLILGAAYALPGSMVVQENRPAQRAIASLIFAIVLFVLMQWLFPGRNGRWL